MNASISQSAEKAQMRERVVRGGKVWKNKRPQ